MSSSKRPNVVLLVCDQMQAFAAGCYGNAAARTPEIDRLAREGVRFEVAVSNNPVCTPARSCLLSGQYSRTATGMCGNVHEDPPNPERVRLVDPTLPEIFQEAGYDTALIGKWHIDPSPELLGFRRAEYPNFQHCYYDQCYWNEKREVREIAGYSNDHELRCLESYLGEVGDSPFFLYYNIGQPHMPIGPGHIPDSFLRLFDPAKIPLRPNVPEEISEKDFVFWSRTYTSTTFFWNHLAGVDPGENTLPKDMSIRHLTAWYYAAVAATDDAVGQVRKTLERSGKWEDTVVLFVSDHGDNLGSHGLFNKGSLIEESIRVPFIVRGTGCASGRIVDEGVTSLVDVMPTLLDLAGLPVPATVQGLSLADTVRGVRRDSPRTEAFIETGNAIALRTPSRLYGIRHDPEEKTSGPPLSFYDLGRDPFEFDNLCGDEAHETERRHWDQILRDWDQSTPWLDAPPPPDVQEYLARIRIHSDAESRPERFHRR